MFVRTSAAEWRGARPRWRRRQSASAVAFWRAAIPSDRASRRNLEPIQRSFSAAPMPAAFRWLWPLQLTKAGHIPVSIRTLAKVKIDRSNEGFAITHIELITEGEVPGPGCGRLLRPSGNCKEKLSRFKGVVRCRNLTNRKASRRLVKGPATRRHRRSGTACSGHEPKGKRAVSEGAVAGCPMA